MTWRPRPCVLPSLSSLDSLHSKRRKRKSPKTVHPRCKQTEQLRCCYQCSGSVLIMEATGSIGGIPSAAYPACCESPAAKDDGPWGVSTGWTWSWPGLQCQIPELPFNSCCMFGKLFLEPSGMEMSFDSEGVSLGDASSPGLLAGRKGAKALSASRKASLMLALSCSSGRDTSVGGLEP